MGHSQAGYGASDSMSVTHIQISKLAAGWRKEAQEAEEMAKIAALDTALLLKARAATLKACIRDIELLPE